MAIPKMEKPFKIGDLGVPRFKETSIYSLFKCFNCIKWGAATSLPMTRGLYDLQQICLSGFCSIV